LEHQSQIVSRASLSGLDRFISRASAATIATKNLLLSLPVEGSWPRCYQSNAT
jgi:hypothetical protein